MKLIKNEILSIYSCIKNNDLLYQDNNNNNKNKNDQDEKGQMKRKIVLRKN